MLTWILAPALVIVAVLIAAAVIARRRSDPLRQRPGPAYSSSTVRKQHSELPRVQTGRTQTSIAQQEKPVATFPPRTLSAVDREAFAAEWAAVQRRFAEDPAVAIGTVDLLVSRVMTDRGYPMANFDQRATDGAANDPAAIESYRAAHAIVRRHHDGGATSEDLQQAMTRFRSLFDELLGPRPTPSKVQPINRRRKVGRERAS